MCVFSSHSFWTSSSLDVPAGVTQEEGHTGFLIHLLSAVRCCCCCLHIKSRSDLYSVLSNIRTGPTDANAFRGHRLTTQKGYTYQKEIKGPKKVNTHAIIFIFIFFHLTCSRWTSSLPSCMWSQRIFPSLPGSRLTIFYRDASSAFLQLVNQWLNFTYSRSHAFRYERKNTNPTLVRIELTTSVLADVQLTY